MTAPPSVFAWVKVLALAGAAITAAAGLLGSGALAVLLMLSEDVFTAAVMVFVMGCLGLAVVVVVREVRDAFVNVGRRSGTGQAPGASGARLSPRSNLQQSYFREPPVT